MTLDTQCCNAECQVCFIVMLSVVRLNMFMLSVVRLNMFMLSVVMTMS